MNAAFQKGVNNNKDLTSRMKSQSSFMASQEQAKTVEKRSGLTRMSVAIANAPEIMTFSS
jgi:hypothetical protein